MRSISGRLTAEARPAVTLANGAYEVGFTRAGGGWSRFGDYAITPWSDDPTRDADGLFIYIRDRDREPEAVWSAGLQPTLRRAARYAAGATPLPRIVREDEGIRSALEVALAGDAPVELRRLTLSNPGDERRTLEVTSYVPLALDRAAAYAGHPAFSRLFIQTEYLPALQGLLARRRPRSPGDPAVSVVHLLVSEQGRSREPAYETDRLLFLGRGRSPAAPAALDPGARLRGSVGSVLDPVLCLRREVVLEPGADASLVLVLAAGLSRADAVASAQPFAAPDRAHAAVAAARDAAPAVGRGGEEMIPLIVGELPSPRPPGLEGDEGADETLRGEDEPLRFFNGYGGFTEAGDEYVIRLGTAGEDSGAGPGAGAGAGASLRLPPLPWINVVANERVGFLVSETGASHTWSGNSRLNRLTPWSNDPVRDPHGEALYLRDEEDGAFWSPTPGPAPGAGPYETRHGFGYTRFRHVSHGLEQDVWMAMAEEDPVKLVRLRVTNRSARPRRLSALGYFEWVLGDTAQQTRQHVRTDVRRDLGAVLARNPASQDYGRHVAFAAAVPARRGEPVECTDDRQAVLGRYGGAAAPAALRERRPLTAGEPPADPCAALRIGLEVGPGQTVECAFLLGQAESGDAVRSLLAAYRTPDAVRAAMDAARAWWRDAVSGVTVDTPSPALDLMTNGWLLYQDISCRLRGRSAFYQSGGAFGYRDQLQDATALVYSRPDALRRQILLHAAQQFPEGDVLHWWHPPAGRGIRTRFSDDLLWLPYVVGFYLDATGDDSILDARTPFLEGRPLEPGEDEALMLPGRSKQDADLVEHCCRVIDRSLTRGAHGLPLMGTGDWNDGMNRVGREGRGESVWLGFFLAAVLDRWVPIVEARGDAERADRYRAYRGSLGDALNDAGWDGGWYRRAYYDDGTALGSAANDECRIDAIAQAWSVLSGVAPADRAEAALDALEEHLVSEREGLIRLLTPPFDRTAQDPGYIKGYIPGVRENGGQYTHGVLWAIRALAALGRTERAAPLLEMMTPVMRAPTHEDADSYKVEPYVVAADIYGAAPHVGRGGWTWYTGSAGWMYRTMLESVLGIELVRGDRLRVRPCIPSSWPGYRLTWRLPDGVTRYALDVRRAAPGAPAAMVVDGEPVELVDGAPVVPLVRDGGRHEVRIEIGDDVAPTYAPADSPAASSVAPLDETTSA